VTDTTIDNSKLRRARDRKGLPRERVSAQLDPPISSKTLERWETDGYRVPLWRAEQLAGIYGVAIAEIEAEAAAA
jgi:predicted transcriptional regulator